MRRHFLSIISIAMFIAAVPVVLAQAQPNAGASSSRLQWFKGNTHTHTLNSDGDSSPADVAQWYKTHGYDFLIITDHEQITDVDPLNASLGDGGKFLVICGQEVTDRFNKKPYHVNGLGLPQVVMPQHGTDIVSTVQNDIDAIRKFGGIPQINHPNFGWALKTDELLKLRGAPLLEIYSGHPLVNVMGGGGVPSLESMWDALLTKDKLYWGVAVDDSHHFKRMDDESAATPGHGWVVVRASRLAPAEILSALEHGEFYSSTGVELEDYQVTSTSITVKIKEKKWSKYRTEFIGANGKVLSESITNPAIYRFSGGEIYVRAKVFESNGKLAWTQPVFRNRK
jgi:hypothetical protein